MRRGMGWAGLAAALLAPPAGWAAEAVAPAGMALVPAGEYSPVIRPASGPATIPVAAFYLDRHAVTNAEFLEFVKARPEWRRSRVDPELAEKGYLGLWAGDLDPGPGAPAASPVVLVSWFAADAYAHWRHLRLPTTAEWERAAEAGYGSPRGRNEAAFERAALDWLAAPNPPVLPAAASPRPNFFGVRGLTDLVWEWVEDFNSPIVGASAESGGASNLVCGGAAAGAADFSDYPAFVRMGFRSSLKPNYVVPNLGFRCALSPGERSLSTLDDTWTDDRGKLVQLSSFRGHPVVLSLFYTRCASACPVTVVEMKRVEAALPPESQARFILVSFDSEKDTAEALRTYRRQMGLGRSWTLLRGDADSVRRLAMLLGVAYGETASGAFAHSSLVTVLNSEGKISYQQAGLGGNPADIAAAVGRRKD